MLRRLLARAAPLTFLRRAAPTPAELGALGEELAARHLRRRGWRVLGRRVRTPRGEVDVVAALAGQLVCVEVKAGRLPAGRVRWRPGGRMDRRRWARQRRAGRWLAARSAGRLRGGRVDLVEVLVDPGGGVEIAHHPDVGPPAARRAVESGARPSIARTFHPGKGRRRRDLGDPHPGDASARIRAN